MMKIFENIIKQDTYKWIYTKANSIKLNEVRNSSDMPFVSDTCQMKYQKKKIKKKGMRKSKNYKQKKVECLYHQVSDNWRSKSGKGTNYI